MIIYTGQSKVIRRLCEIVNGLLAARPRLFIDAEGYIGGIVMTDRLINHTQGEAIIAALTRIAVALERVAAALEPAQENGGEQSGGEE